MPIQRQCPHCDRHFTRSEHLLRHVRTHTKEKPFKCAVCSKAYSREDTLVRHLKSHHPDCITGQTGFGGMTESPAHEVPLSPHGSIDWTTQSLRNRASVSEHAPAEDSFSHHLQEQTGYLPPQEDLITFGLTGTPLMQTTIHSPARAWEFWSTSNADEFQLPGLDDGFVVDARNIAPEEVFNQDMEMQHQECPTKKQSAEASSPSDFNLPPPIHNVERIWFTRMHADVDCLRATSMTNAQDTSPMTHLSEVTDVDDQYRLQLSKAVHKIQPPDGPLPSSDFLNLCVRMYFTRFNPLFPILHSATFRPTAHNSLLILSITSIGCLFLGSPAAARRGRQIFRKLNKAILASWDDVILQDNDQALAMLQAAVLGQTFALLSGDPRDIAQCETFHGSLITLARRRKVFGTKAAISEILNLTGPELETTWRLWAKREEINRVGAALGIHDSELCALIHSEPLLRHATLEAPPLASSILFSASTAVEWAYIIQSEATMSEMFFRTAQTQQSASFSAYVSLEGIGTLISKDWRNGRLDEPAFNSYNEYLLGWYNKYNDPTAKEQSGMLSLTMLWHWVYMSLLVDLDQLERAIGRDGTEAADAAVLYISDWISSPNSTRCTLHAFLAQRQLQSLPFGSVPAIHVPRILFSAAVTWYCYLQYGAAENVVTSIFENLNVQFPEFGILSQPADKRLSEITRLSWKRGNMSDLKAVTLCQLGDSLQHIKHWGIAREFAKIVACLIYRNPQDSFWDQ